MCKLSKAWDFYNENILNTQSTRSIQSESARWKRIDNYFKNYEIKNITSLKIMEFKNYLFKLDLSPQSVTHHLSFLLRIMRRALMMGLYIGIIPIFEMPKFDNKRSRFLSIEEAKLLLETLKSMSSLWHDITFIALMTGLRAGEIFKLVHSNIDLNNKLIHVVDSKTNLNRNVPISLEVKEVLFKYFNSKNKYLFTNNKNEKITEVSRLYPRAVKINNLNQVNHTERRDKVVFHTLRHTFASWLIQKDVPLAVVSQLLGHTNIRMTMRYAHLAPNQGREAVELLSF